MKFHKILRAAGYAACLLGSAAALAAAGNVVEQKDKSFGVKELTISAGESVTFVNSDSVKHNILIKDIDFNSGSQDPGAEATAKFDAAGKYKVRCGIHPKMKMTVKVN